MDYVQIIDAAKQTADSMIGDPGAWTSVDEVDSTIEYWRGEAAAIGEELGPQDLDEAERADFERELRRALEERVQEILDLRDPELAWLREAAGSGDVCDPSTITEWSRAVWTPLMRVYRADDRRAAALAELDRRR